MPANVAFLVVDMQNQFKDTYARIDSYGKVVEHINYVAGLMRGAHQPVVMIKDIESVEADGEAAAVISDIQVDESDIVVCKLRSNAFWETDLEDALRRRDVGFVVVSGFTTEYCVLCTYEGARERGFRAALLQNALLSEDAEANAAALRQRHVISYSALEFLLASRGE